MSPRRLQRKRTKGWRKPPGAVIVTRPSRWGNPWRTVDGPGGLSRAEAVRRFERYLRDRRYPHTYWHVDYPSDEEIRTELGGRDLVCWCPLPADAEPDVCHAAVLLRLANNTTQPYTGSRGARVRDPWQVAHYTVDVPTGGLL